MSRDQSITWLEDALRNVCVTVFDWAMHGWPDVANAYRRDARRLQRMIARVKNAENL